MSSPLPPTSFAQAGPAVAWYRELSGYQWLVLTLAAFGWMFDCMDQQLFSIARRPAVQDLLGPGATSADVAEHAAYSTMILMIGWAIGGVACGILGDRIGRVKTMTLTILLFSVFTGLTYFARNIWEFNIYRLLCSLGVGGQFAVAISLVAEVMPGRARPYALGLLQALSTVGNMTAGAIGIGLGQLEQAGTIQTAWRYMFLIGALPIPLAIAVYFKLREPESWVRARAAKQRMGSFQDLLGEPRWRRNAITGMLITVSGVIGLWGIGFFSYDLLRPVLERSFAAQGYAGAELAGKVTMWIGLTSILQNFGCFFGVHAFTWLTQRTGRKKAFAVSFVAAMLMTSFTFLQLRELSQIFWMIPLMGFTQLALFGGYAIYLPELFPTRLRSTGTSFCYNVGRLLAAAGPLGLGLLTSRVFQGPDAMRYAGMTMSLIFVLGLVTLPFAPETKDNPLPE
jgi:MFS family permease